MEKKTETKDDFLVVRGFITSAIYIKVIQPSHFPPQEPPTFTPLHTHTHNHPHIHTTVSKNIWGTSHIRHILCRPYTASKGNTKTSHRFSMCFMSLMNRRLNVKRDHELLAQAWPLDGSERHVSALMSQMLSAPSFVSCL